MRNMICTAGLALLLAACGGGGGNAGSSLSPPTPTTTAGNLDVYAGTWTSACASHAVDTVSIKRAAGTNNALTIGVTRTYYATTTCTGDAIATQTWSADATATYVGTVTSSINPGPGLALLPATIDKMVAQLPQRTVTLVGTFVTHKTISGEANWCIDYAGGSVCVPDRLYPAEAAPFDGLVVQGTDLYEVKANGTNYDAVERLTKQ